MQTAFLTIAARELRRRARQPATHRSRWLAAGLALLALAPDWIRPSPDPAITGQQIFLRLAFLAFLFCLVEGARHSARGLSEERGQGALELLCLTRLGGGDLVLGKLFSGALSSLYSLLAILPVLGLPLLSGGVSGAEFARLALALVLTLFLALCAGLYMSARSRNGLKALFATLGLLAAIAGLPPLLDLLLHAGRLTAANAGLALVSPALALRLVLDANYGAAPHAFWLCLAAAHLLGCAFLLAASVSLRRVFREPGRLLEPGRRPPALRAGRIHRWREHDPVAWLARQDRWTPWWVGLLMAAAAVAPLSRLFFVWLFPGVPIPALGWGLIGLAQMLAFFGLRFLVAGVACRFFVATRRSGDLELLLSAPLDREGILRSHRRACWSVLLAPLLILSLLVEVIPVAARLVGLAGMPWFDPGPAAAGALRNWALNAGCLLADAWALIWVGAWTSLRARSVGSAVARTYLLVVLAPFLVTAAGTALAGAAGLAMPRALPVLTVAFLLLKDLGFWLYARHALKDLLDGLPRPDSERQRLAA